MNDREEMAARYLTIRYTPSGWRVLLAVSLYVGFLALLIGGIAFLVWRK